MKANNLRQIIASKLSNMNAYYGFNTGSFDDYNYKINYQINNARLTEHERIYLLDFDIWCKDGVDVETITDELEALFNYKSYEEATFYLESRYHADEKEIYRRTLTYEVRTFKED